MIGDDRRIIKEIYDEMIVIEELWISRLPPEKCFRAQCRISGRSPKLRTIAAIPVSDG